MDQHLAELIGIIMGDGYLSNPAKHYRIGIVGNPVSDREYFDYVQGLIKIVWNKQTRIFHQGRGLRIVVNSKPAFTQLVTEYGLPVGEGKCEKIVIPAPFAQNWSMAKHTIRGLIDTDGSIFVADKPGSPRYPSIELTTCSHGLASQLKDILERQRFRVANIRGHQKPGARRVYKVALNGYANLERWLAHIGFSNPIKRRKAEAALARRMR